MLIQVSICCKRNKPRALILKWTLCLCWGTHVCVIYKLWWCLLIVNPELNRKENLAFTKSKDEIVLYLTFWAKGAAFKSSQFLDFLFAQNNQGFLLKRPVFARPSNSWNYFCWLFEQPTSLDWVHPFLLKFFKSDKYFPENGSISL